MRSGQMLPLSRRLLNEAKSSAYLIRADFIGANPNHVFVGIFLFFDSISSSS